ncbi:MAG: serine/threonine-protein kinase [Polyangiales bacterium]
MGKFHLVASLGQGGMAKVYLALMAGPAGFNKLLVVKVLREDVGGGNEEAVRMFWDEARLTAQMLHPNIVHTYEVGEVDGRYYLAMEYLDGQTYRAVQTRLEAEGGLPLREDLRILAETARGLHYAHKLRGFNGEALNVVHRDVSPQNVFITYDGQVKLLDFGIAKAHGAENLTQVGIIKGKLDYIAPEQLRGDVLDGRADVFALGAMLWEAVTKQRFAGGRQLSDVVKAHKRIEGSEPNVRMVKPDVTDALADIVDRALAPTPEARFASAADLADAIDAYLEASGEKASAKTLSALVSPLFVAERAAIQKLIDQQVTLTQSGMIDLGDATGDLPRVGQSDTRSASGLFAPRGDTMVNSRSGMRADLLEASRAASGHTAKGAWPRESADSTPARTRRSFVVALVLAAAAGAGAVRLMPRDREVIMVERASAPERTGATQRATPPAALEPREVAAESVIIDLKVSPPEAEVTLDGTPLSLPFSGEFSKSSAVHHLEASAEGHRFLRRSVRFDQDQVIQLVLEPLSDRPAPARRGAAPRPPTEPAPAEQPAAQPPAIAAPPAPEEPAPGTPLRVPPRSKRIQLDVSDPYASPEE